MKLSEEIKRKIYEDFEKYKDTMYDTLTEKKSKKKCTFYYNPSQIVIKRIEKFESLDGDICDPCCGNGLFLASCIIAGADPKRCYGIELDENQAQLCRKRLAIYGVPPENIIVGDCLDNNTWKKLPRYKKGMK